MRFSTDKETFLGALEVATKAVGKVSMPILTGVLLTVNDGNVTVTGSNLDLTIVSNFTVLDFENGSTVVDAKLLHEYVKKLKNGNVVVSTESEKSLLVKSGRSHSSMITMTPKDYPNLKNRGSEATQLSFVSSELRDGIREVIYSTAQEETRPILTGVLFEVQNDRLNLVALDGYRLSVKTIPVDANSNIKAVIPGKALKEVLKLLPKNSDTDNDKDIDIQLNISNNFAEFIIGDVSVSTRLLEGDFIKYDSIIPQDFTTKIIIDKEELQSVISRASIMDEKTNLIKMVISRNQIKITSNSQLGKVEDEVEIKQFEGKEITIAFNSKFWLELLAALTVEDGLIEVNLTGNLNPVIIKKVNDNKFTGLILPVRLAGANETAA